MPVNPILEIENDRKIKVVQGQKRTVLVRVTEQFKGSFWISGRAWSRSHAISWELSLSLLSLSLSVLFLSGLASPLSRLFPHRDPEAPGLYFLSSVTPTEENFSNISKTSFRTECPWTSLSHISIPKSYAWVMYQSLELEGKRTGGLHSNHMAREQEKGGSSKEY